MTFLYWLLSFAGGSSIVLGGFKAIFNYIGNRPADMNEGISLLVTGLVLLVIADIGNKLTAINMRLDVIETRQKRLRRLFLDLTPGASSEESATLDDD